MSDTKIVVEYIDKCLTSTYQPCDVIINKPLKAKVHSYKYNHIRGLSSKPGREKLIISRKVFTTNFIAASEQIYDRIIANSFNEGGLNIY